MAIDWGKRYGTKESYYLSADERWILRQRRFQYKPNNNARSRTVTEWTVTDRYAPIPTDPCAANDRVVAKASSKKACVEQFEQKLSKGLIPVRVNGGT